MFFLIKINNNNIHIILKNIIIINIVIFWRCEAPHNEQVRTACPLRVSYIYILKRGYLYIRVHFFQIAEVWRNYVYGENWCRWRKNVTFLVWFGVVLVGLGLFGLGLRGLVVGVFGVPQDEHVDAVGALRVSYLYLYLYLYFFIIIKNKMLRPSDKSGLGF